MGKEEVFYSGGLQFITFIVFLCLKLGGSVSWAWWIVTLPLWIEIPIVLAILLFVFAIMIIVGIVAGLAYIIIWIISLFILRIIWV